MRTNLMALAVIAGVMSFMIPVAARAEAPPDGCAKVAAAIEESNGQRSAEEIAAKLNIDVETVRNCWKEWEKSKKGATKPQG